MRGRDSVWATAFSAGHVPVSDVLLGFCLSRKRIEQISTQQLIEGLAELERYGLAIQRHGAWELTEAGRGLVV